VLAVATVLGVALVGCGGGSSGISAATGTARSAATSSTRSDAPASTQSAAPEANAAGDIPDSQVFVPFTPPGGGYTVSVPQGWAQSTESGAILFTDKYHNIRVQSQAAPTAVDVASAQATEVPALQTSVPGFALTDVRAVQRSAGRAVLIVYQAMSPLNTVTGASVPLSVERYEFARNGREIVLTLAGPKGSDDVDPWRKVTDSFRWQQ
jgi:hypothetical protein